MARALTIAVIAAGLVAAGALAARPRGNANYVAVDAKGRPAITLWMRTRTSMIVFVCYRWGPGPHHGDHYNNDEPIHVGRDGRFSYDGPATLFNRRKPTTLRFSGRFVTRDRAVGTMNAPCMRHRRFVARFAP